MCKGLVLNTSSPSVSPLKNDFNPAARIHQNPHNLNHNSNDLSSLIRFGVDSFPSNSFSSPSPTDLVFFDDFFECPTLRGTASFYEEAPSLSHPRHRRKTSTCGCSLSSDDLPPLQSAQEEEGESQKRGSSVPTPDTTTTRRKSLSTSSISSSSPPGTPSISNKNNKGSLASRRKKGLVLSISLSSAMEVENTEDLTEERYDVGELDKMFSEALQKKCCLVAAE